MCKYINDDGLLNDEKVAKDIRKAADMYEDGEIVESHDLLLEILEAIGEFTLY